MTSVNDRMRLKDRIVTNVAKGIKLIQECQLYGREEVVILTNTDYPCHKLCEQLDHAFLHGLRHISHGYWKVVSEFTRKEAVKEIKRLRHVTTDLGRGRAWMFMALNEGLLESYMRCFQENGSVVAKHYVREALVLDQQRLNVLVTLTSGLDFAKFQLDYDVAYLDLSCRPPRSRPHSNDGDRVSLCSMDSITSSRSRNSSFCRLEAAQDFQLFPTRPRSRTFTDSDTASATSRDQESPSLQTDQNSIHSCSVDSGCHVDNISLHLQQRNSITSEYQSSSSNSSNVENISRMKRLERVVNVDHDYDNIDTGLEVIRMKGNKGHRLKKKKTKKGISYKKSEICLTETSYLFEKARSLTVKSENSESDGVSVDSLDRRSSSLSLRSPGDGTESAGSPLDNDDDKDSFMPKKVGVVEASHCADQDINQSSNQEKETSVTEHGHKHEHDSSVHLTPGLQQKDNDIYSHYHDSSVHLTPCLQQKDPGTHSQKDVKYTFEQNDGGDIYDVDDLKMPLLPEDVFSKQQNADSSLKINANISAETTQDFDGKVTISSDSGSVEDSPEPGALEDNIDGTRRSSSSLLNDRVNYILNQPASQFQCNFIEDEEEDEIDDENEMEADGSLKVDNNTLLYLMLDVFGDSEEQYLKMFGSRQGHTEGENKVTFIVITDRHLYLLQQKQSDHRFMVDVAILFSDIDFVLLSLNCQVLHIVCKNRRKQYWITTGDENVTRGIVSCLSTCAEKSESGLSELTVLTDATAHEIALKKYIAVECRCDASDAEIHCYSLIHWQDPNGRDAGSDMTHREGYLLHRVETSMFLVGHTWKPTYVVLRDRLLCLFNDKDDSKPHTFVQLGEEGCVGCRRALNMDREHCIEIILSNKASLLICAATESEVGDWLLSLCQAVSEGKQNQNHWSSCLPCCLVLTKHKLLMCHEDVQTSFFRTLGSANIHDITAITVDSAVESYCILEFESQEKNISSEKWILYFNSKKEATKFSDAVSSRWSEHFQVDVPIVPIEDFSLQKWCQDTAVHLANSIKVRV